ncbi:MAG: hypothetical protein K2Y18_05630 [Alphaproteobacteria bacterium]|jgi:hypothetical protein|nr:hypothetical protein [Alphaproteobacteria bacterium]
MCFSASASFTASGVLATMAFLNLRVAPSRNLRLIAMIPLIFALQQLLEGIVWVTINTGQTHTLIHKLGVYGFLFFGVIFWPVWVPAILSRLEQNAFRRKWLVGLGGLGLLIALFSGVMMISMGNKAEIITHHMGYALLSGTFDHFLSSYGEVGYFVLIGAYFLVIVGSCFLSTLPCLWVLGLLAGLAFILAQVFYAYAFNSVWCYFAAMISLGSYYVVRRSS